MEKYQVEKYQSTQVENDYQPLSFTLTTSVKIEKLISWSSIQSQYVKEANHLGAFIYCDSVCF